MAVATARTLIKRHPELNLDHINLREASWKGSKTVAIAGSTVKRMITATFVITLSGDFLPIQLIYGGKTMKSLPPVKFTD